MNDDEEFSMYFTPKQSMALDILDTPSKSGKPKELMYGGAKGGGKSVFMVEWAFLECQRLIRLFGLQKEPDNIIPVGYLGRKRAVDFNKTTLETWKKIIPSSKYRIRPLDKEIIVENRVKIYYGGMDDEQSVNKMNSAEFSFIGIDQAEEISRDDLGLLKGTLRLRLNGKIPNYKVLLTANPAPSFLKGEYIDNPPADDSKVFIQALPSDNPFLDENYVNTLIDAFKHRPELIRAYVHGSWDDLEGLDILIKGSWVTQCVGNQPKEQQNIRVTSCDVARYGQDETVIYNFLDYDIVKEDISGMNNTETNAARIIRMANENNSDIIVIDGDGYGAGVCDTVRALLSTKSGNKMQVLEINSGRRAQNDQRYLNAKTEFWFHAAELMAEKRVGIPNDPVLIADLGSIKYQSAENGRFRVDAKKDVRKRISRSPDRGDCAVYGWWAHQFVQKKVYDYQRIEMQEQPIDRGGYGWSGLPGHRGQTSQGGYGWT